jgi:hypothetical protein
MDNIVIETKEIIYREEIICKTVIGLPVSLITITSPK